MVSHERKIPDQVFDVAIAYLPQDASLALALADRIGEYCDVLCASNSLEHARVLVILRRPVWVQIPVKEMNAGETVLLVNLEAPPADSAALHSPNLSVDYARYGFEQTIGVIKNTLEHSGVRLKVETALEHAERLQNADGFRRERDLFLQSPAGLEAASALKDELFSRIEEEFANVSQTLASSPLSFAKDADFIVLRMNDRNPVSCALQWSFVSNGNPENQELRVTEASGSLLSYGERQKGLWVFEKPSPIRSYAYALEYTTDRTMSWKSKHQHGRLYSSDQMVEQLLKNFLDLIGRAGQKALRYA